MENEITIKIFDKKNKEFLRECPYEGCNGACPYYVYIERLEEFYCYEDMYEQCVLHKDQ